MAKAWASSPHFLRRRFSNPQDHRTTRKDGTEAGVTQTMYRDQADYVEISVKETGDKRVAVEEVFEWSGTLVGLAKCNITRHSRRSLTALEHA
jgi:hypothetical protein